MCVCVCVLYVVQRFGAVSRPGNEHGVRVLIGVQWGVLIGVQWGVLIGTVRCPDWDSEVS